MLRKDFFIQIETKAFSVFTAPGATATVVTVIQEETGSVVLSGNQHLKPFPPAAL